MNLKSVFYVQLKSGIRPILLFCACSIVPQYHALNATFAALSLVSSSQEPTLLKRAYDIIIILLWPQDMDKMIAFLNLGIGESFETLTLRSSSSTNDAHKRSFVVCVCAHFFLSAAARTRGVARGNNTRKW